MSTNDIEKKHHQNFESIMHVNEHDIEYWYARELQPLLEYNSWVKFKRLIERAIIACENSGQRAEDHFILCFTINVIFI